MLIFITGFMASGKSKSGKVLAKRLGYSFIDLDALIESKMDSTITQIFSEKGEDVFRLIEQNVLHEICDLENTVVSCGGGTPCFFNNIEVMNYYGQTFYIDSPVEMLFERLKLRKTKRPLIADLTDAELLSFIKSKLEARIPYYNKANYKIENQWTKERNADDIIDIIKKIKQ